MEKQDKSLFFYFVMTSHIKKLLKDFGVNNFF